ncbi:MAG: DUF3883 domain-containing protein [Prevotellaceae bacterium]|jgi:hypothetical protein|nr:DUF3883 domain-containing protein [Prevotellaceae bacterium]
MSNQIVFFRVGWMDFYQGLSKTDAIINGGKFVRVKGYGHEIFNFEDFRGNVYGYVQPSGHGTIKIEKLGASKADECISGITVVWIATKPKGRSYIVGWYRNATVYRREQKAPKESRRSYHGDSMGFYASANSADVRLLAKDERVIYIPKGKAHMGRSNVWYADNNPDFIKTVRNYIFENKNPFAKSSTKCSKISAEQRQLVEKNAIKEVMDYYENLGYEIISVEKDNVGWDLNAKNEMTELKLEVKGLSGNLIAAELTPNEYKNLQKNLDSYRLCIVTNALTETPNLKIFSYSEEKGGKWTTENGIILKFEDLVGARVCV